MDRDLRRGFSLLETIVAIFLMTLTLWSVQLLYIGILGGSQKSDVRQEAVTEAENLLGIWKQKTIEAWPAGPGAVPSIPPESYSVEDSYKDFIYRVDVSGRITNPYRDDATALIRAPVLDMQTVGVTVFYADKANTLTSRKRFVKVVAAVSN